MITNKCQGFVDVEAYAFLKEEFPDLKRRFCVKEYRDNNLIAAIVGVESNDGIFIEYVRVLPQYRKQGIFKDLVKTLFPFKNLRCYIRETNLASIKAFESVGFKFIQFKTPYSNGDKKLEYGISTTSP